MGPEAEKVHVACHEKVDSAFFSAGDDGGILGVAHDIRAILRSFYEVGGPDDQ
jgi:hypothetical protein